MEESRTNRTSSARRSNNMQRTSIGTSFYFILKQISIYYAKQEQDFYNYILILAIMLLATCLYFYKLY